MFTLGTKQCVDPLELYEQFAEENLPTDLFAGKANTFTVRSGDKPSGGGLLMRQEDFDALDLTAAHTLTVIDQLAHTLTFAGFYIVGGVRVLDGADDDPHGVYLVEIADVRKRLAMAPINKAYNLRKPSGSGYVTTTLNAGVAWTWDEMVADLWAVANVSSGLGTYPGLPFSPDGTPGSFDFYGSYALASLATALRRLGCDIRPDHTAGTFGIVKQGGGTDSSYYSSWTADRKFDGQAVRADAATRPEKARVRFRVLPVPDDASPWYSIDVAFTTTTGVLAGTVVMIDDDLIALGTTPSNLTDLTSRASERAADWERKFTKLEIPAVVQYREYLKDAATAVGERRAVAIFEDTGDGYVTESHSADSPFPLFPRFTSGEAGALCGSPVIYRIVVGGSLTTTSAIVSLTSVLTSAVMNLEYQNVKVDENGCFTFDGESYCETAGSTCTGSDPEDGVKYWCVGGVCYKVYYGITPTGDVVSGPFDTLEECGEDCGTPLSPTIGTTCTIGYRSAINAVDGPGACDETNLWVRTSDTTWTLGTSTITWDGVAGDASVWNWTDTASPGCLWTANWNGDFPDPGNSVVNVVGFQEVMGCGGDTDRWLSCCSPSMMMTMAISPKAPKSAVKLEVCSKLSLEVVQIPGSARADWRKCEGGYGSTTGDGRTGYVCGCSTPGVGVWRIGQECGPACPGYPTGG